MSSLRSHDINELRSVLPFGKVEPGDIVKHVDDSSSFGTVVFAEQPTHKQKPELSTIRYPHQVVVPKPERQISVLWTKEPKPQIDYQVIKNKQPSPIKTRWDVEELEDLETFHGIDRHARLIHSRRFNVEEVYESMEKDRIDLLHESGAEIEFSIDGTVRVRRTLPCTPENIREYNSVRSKW